MSNQLKDNRLFHLKQFSLSHHGSTMQVGTDAMLLGLFIDASKCSKALEIGTGCGIISLLVASKYATAIDTIDIDSESITETTSNFKRSPFYHRLRALEADFQGYSQSHHGKYDLMFSNPPFFVNDFRPENLVKKIARHTDSLSYQDICKGAVKLLDPSGKFCLVLPFDKSRLFLEVATKFGLNLQKQQLVIPKRGLEANRINMQFGFDQSALIVSSTFFIREDDGSFTDQYISYLKDYYIGLK